MVTKPRSRWFTSVVTATATALAPLALLVPAPPSASADTVRAAAVQPVAADSFGRTAATGWGSADVGGVWSLAGSSTLFSVGGGVGTITMSKPAQGPMAELKSVSARDVVLTADLSINKVANGGGATASFWVRKTATGSEELKVVCTADGSVVLSVAATNAAGAETTLGGWTTVPGIRGSDTITVKLQTIASGGSSTISAKAWKSSAPEPSGWLKTVTDSSADSQAAGDAAIRAYLSGTSTSAPVTASFDNLNVTAMNATPPPATVTKVLTFIEENHSLAEMQAGMPYTYSLAQQYGYASHWSATTHPSLPNYLALAGGSTFGVTDDNDPALHPISGPDLFGEAIAAGKTAKSYQESMTSNCHLTSAGRYAVKHNPWAYFTDDRANCAQFDVPSGTVTSGALHDDIVNGTLPDVGEVTPNLDNDAHDGSLLTADNWMKIWMQLIFASPDWQSGHLAIMLTADEDDSSQGNLVLTTVIHPSQNHNVVSTPLTHYSWTAAMTELAKAPCIGAGCQAPSAATAFGLSFG